MAAQYPNKVILGNGQTMIRPSSVDDNTWNKLISGYITRFGPLKNTQSSAQKTPKTSTTRTTTNQPTTTSSSTNNYTAKARQNPDYERLSSQGYSDYKISLMPVTSQSSTQTSQSTNNQPSNVTTPEQPTTTNAPVESQQDQAAINEAIKVLDQYYNDGAIDFGTYSFFKEAVNLWNPDDEINYAKILSTFDDIVRSEINPKFDEMAMIFKDDIERNLKGLKEGRSLQLESEEMNNTQELRNTKEDLARRGMTFSGDAVRALGTESAYGQDNVPNIAIPTFGNIGEGELLKKQRIAASDSSLRYNQTIENLAREAETTLGSTVGGALIPGVSPLGGVEGSLQEDKQKAKANVLNSLYGQEYNNYENKKPINVL